MDTTDFMDLKVGVNLVNVAQGFAGQRGAQLRRRLREQGLGLPILGDNDETTNREYVRPFVLQRDSETGERFGLRFGEPYHYIGPEPATVDDYMRKSAVKL